MSIRPTIYILLTILLSACAVTWQKAMKYGEVPKTFSDSIAVETSIGLMIVPVTIRGQEYRFLYDTGAPFSISQKVQEYCSFEVISEGEIVDTDNNHSKVEFVEVDTLWLNNTPFINQTAFVGDFSSNPKIQCLEIDGIIGANLMQHCNWTVDFEKQQLSFFNTIPDTIGALKVHFKTNNQFDLIVNLEMGKTKANNIKIDYGSNGSLSIEKGTYNKLFDMGVSDTFLIESGFSRSGIIGTEVTLEEKLSPLDSLTLGEVLFENIVFSSSTSTLLGTQLLSQYIVSIDWASHQLYFKPTCASLTEYTTYPFSAGYNKDKGLYIQSVIQSAAADSLELTPGMRIHSVNEIVFSKDNFCAYMDLINEEPDTLHLVIEKDSTLVPMVIVKEALFPSC